jgi:glutamine amidotransferase
MGFYIVIIDYGVGNLKSIYNALKYLGVQSVISSDLEVISNSDGIILPGVGAFRDAIANLSKNNLSDMIKSMVNIHKPIFTICLGMQLLFTKSYEMGEFQGLNLIKGNVIQFNQKRVNKIPQIGWNSIQIQDSSFFLFNDIPNDSYFYFVHSYYVVPENTDEIRAVTKYGDVEFCSVISNKIVSGVQFHPEKSGRFGLKMYQNFINYCKK